MAKLPAQYRFIDLSDYGRSAARIIARSLENTSTTPLHLTTSFIIAGLLAIVAILYGYKITAAFLLILKSILDAADGELSRIKKTPSYIGRYYDSIADIILNFLFLLAICHVSNGSMWLMLLAFVGLQLQGTLYNYYYVILRNSVQGDTTSRIFEDSIPTAFDGESQKWVNVFYKVYNYLYIAFDKTIYLLDKNARDSMPFPKWFMTMLSTFGLGFQLLIMAVMLVLNLDDYIILFFIYFSIFILIFILIRRLFLR